MRSLVTGGAGFIGSHLVEALVHRGESVFVIDDLSNSSMMNLASVASKIQFRKHDVSSGLPELPSISHIYHLACHPRQISLANPVRDCQVNLIGTINILEFAKRTRAKVLFTSNTGIVSNPPRLPVDESFPPNPLTPYDAHKLASEHMLRVYHHVYGTPTVTVRFASIYGPRQRVNETLGWRPVIPEFASKLLRGDAPMIDGDGEQTRDFLYVKDAVDGVIRAMASDSDNGDVFILGSNTETSILHLYELISDLLGVKMKPKHGPRKKEEIMCMRYDYSKATRTFGWVPKASLREGLELTVSSLR